MRAAILCIFVFCISILTVGCIETVKLNFYQCVDKKIVNMRFTIEIIKERIEEKGFFKRNKKSVEVKILAGILYYLEYR